MEQFEALIQKDDAGRLTFFEIPFHARERFCKQKGTIYVSGTINGAPYRGKLLSRGGGKFLMVIDKALQKSIGFDGQAMPAHITMFPEELEPAGRKQEEPGPGRRLVRSYIKLRLAETADCRFGPALQAGACLGDRVWLAG